MKSLVTLFLRLIQETGELCSVDTSRDTKSILARFEDEGFEFFTLTLPTLGTALERALALGRFSPDLVSGFRSSKSTPVLFGAFFDLIFDRKSGSVLDDPSIESIRSLRQLTLFFKKIELECTPKRVQSAFDDFVKSDSEVGQWESQVDCSTLVEFHQLGSLLFSELFSKVDEDISSWSLEPRHGGGATADRLNGNQKFLQPTWHHRLESVAPYWRYATTRGFSSEVYDRVDFREPGAETPVRVISVPKTMAAPRIIAIEPTCMQYVQQGILRSIVKETDRSYLSDLIGITSQIPNQELARIGSLKGELATLDLKEASDRVSNLLVMTLTAGFPHLHDAVQASRSLTADVPGHGVIPLNRFASMGSALCFPFEAMVFLTVVLLGIQDAYGPLRRRSHVSELVGRVRIYGDDIIIPVDTVDHVMLRLSQFGFVVNHNKSFWTGRFRESCGKEYYAGEDVTFCRVRRQLPASRGDVDEIVSAVSLANQLYKSGLWGTSQMVQDELSELIPLPAVADTSQALGMHRFTGFSSERNHPNLHYPLVRAAVVKHRKRLSPIDNDAALMKTLAVSHDEPYGPFNEIPTEVDHLVYAGRPDASNINIRWIRPF